MLEERPAVLRCKVAIVGDATVGKTALVQMFCSGNTHFPKEYHMTPVADLKKHDVPLMSAGGQTVVRRRQPSEVELYLVDTGGHDVFRESAPWEGATAAILVYDCTNRASFQHLSDWVTRLKTSAALSKGTDGMLNAVVVASKEDLATERLSVKADEAQAWAKTQGMGFFRVSTVPPGRGVDAPFKCVAQRHADAYDAAVARYEAAAGAKR